MPWLQAELKSDDVKYNLNGVPISRTEAKERMDYYEKEKGRILMDEQKTAVETKKTGWYKRATPGDGSVYYTPFRQSKTINLLANDGLSYPKPKEIMELLEKYPAMDPWSTGTGLFTVYNHELAAEPDSDLPFGSYSFEPSNPDLPPRLVPFDLRQDTYIRLRGMYDSLAGDIKDFLNGEATYRDMGIQYRRGLLLYGPPGNGKTSLIRELIRHDVPKDSVVIFMDALPGRQFIDNIKKTLADRLKIFVFEELAAVLETSRLEKVLDFLDGERSVDRSMVIATTNYPERLPSNLVDRPSRFDRLYKMPDPDESIRKAILTHFLKHEISDLDLEATKGLSVVALREVALLVRNRKFTIQRATLALKEHREMVKKEFNEEKSIGIGFHRNRYSGGAYDED